MRPMQLIQPVNGVYHVQSVEMCIAQRLSRFICPVPNFDTMFKKFMSEVTNILYVNRDFDKQIAYFRYVDGSTVHLNNLISYWTAPCPVCTDVRKCTCTIPNELDL